MRYCSGSRLVYKGNINYPERGQQAKHREIISQTLAESNGVSLGFLHPVERSSFLSYAIRFAGNYYGIANNARWIHRYPF